MHLGPKFTILASHLSFVLRPLAPSENKLASILQSICKMGSQTRLAPLVETFYCEGGGLVTSSGNMGRFSTLTGGPGGWIMLHAEIQFEMPEGICTERLAI